MLTDTSHQRRIRAHTIVSNPHDRAAIAALGARSHMRWRFFGRRDEVTVSQRCLALHLHFASPHSALD
jgi:hypothetical protein